MHQLSCNSRHHSGNVGWLVVRDLLWLTICLIIEFYKKRCLTPFFLPLTLTKPTTTTTTLCNECSMQIPTTIITTTPTTVWLYKGQDNMPCNDVLLFLTFFYINVGNALSSGHFCRIPVDFMRWHREKNSPNWKKPLNENEINVDIHVNETVISGWLAGWRTDCLAG